jgi:hypothetical protein
VSSTIEPRYLLAGDSVGGSCSEGSMQVAAGPVYSEDSVTPSAPTVEKSNGLIE